MIITYTYWQQQIFIRISDSIVWPLSDYLKNKNIFSLYGKFSSTNGTVDIIAMQRKMGQLASYLTFPAGDSGRKLSLELDYRLKLKGKIIDTTAIYFGYQIDKMMVMQTIVENILHFFLPLRKHYQADILGYISRLASLESRNENSNIIQQTIILHELLSWYYSSTMERSVSDTVPSSGRLWLLNDSLMSIFTEGTKARVTLRNLTSKMNFELDVKNLHQKASINQNDNFLSIQKLGETEIPNLPEILPTITPELVIASLPFSLYNRFNEGHIGWESIESDHEIKSLIENLDSVSILNLHSIGIIYLPPKIPIEDCFKVKLGSERFNRFLSEIGSLINVTSVGEGHFVGGLPRNGSDGLYGIIWKDELRQVFFHVNTLLQHVNKESLKSSAQAGTKEAELIKEIFPSSDTPSNSFESSEKKLEELLILKSSKYIFNNNVAIIWNESGSEISEEFLKNNAIKIFIIISPLVTPFCKVQIINLINMKKGDYVTKITHKTYGSLPEFTLINNFYLARMIIRAGIVADQMVQKSNQGLEKGIFINNFLKRSGLIMEIKKNAYISNIQKNATQK